MGFSFLTQELAIDLGTANTVIFQNDQIVLDEPSIVALDNNSGKPIALGHQAKLIQDRENPGIKTVRPLRDGVIADFNAAELMIRGFIKKVNSKRRSLFTPNLKVVVGIPSGSTEVEIRAVRDSTEHAGGRDVYLIFEPMAAALGIGLDVEAPKGSMVVDIGGGTTEIAVISLGGIVQQNSVRVAGDVFTSDIQYYLKQQHNIKVGEPTAEKLKIQAGAACLDTDENGDEIIKTVKTSGRDIISGLPKIIDVTNRDIMLALQESVDIVIDGIKATIEKAPPEIAADIAESGIVLSGGGGLIYNLDKLIEKRTGMKATIAETAFEAVAMGTGMSLNDIEKLKVYASSVKRR